MKLIDKIAYRIATNFAVALRDAHDYEHYGYVTLIPSYSEAPSFEELDATVGYFTERYDNDLPFDFDGENKLESLWSIFRATQTVNLAIWLSKKKKEALDKSKEP